MRENRTSGSMSGDGRRSYGGNWGTGNRAKAAGQQPPLLPKVTAPILDSTDLGSRLYAVCGIAKAVATLTQRGEIRRSVSTATEIARRAACWAARAHTAISAGTEPGMPLSGRAGQRDDRKVRSPFQVPDLECEPHARPPADRRLWPSTASVARPSRPGLVARAMMGRQSSEVDLVGGRAAEPAVGALTVVPVSEE